MRKSILLPGLVLIVLGAVVISYGLQLSSELGIEAGEWQVTWYSMENIWGFYGDSIETDTFPMIFSYDPLVHAIREEPIGFKAVLDIYMFQEIQLFSLP